MLGLSLLFGGFVFAALLLKVGIKDAQAEMRDDTTPIGVMAWLFYTFALTLALVLILRNIVWEFVTPKELNDNLLFRFLFIPALYLIYKLSSEIAYYFVHGETTAAGDERQRKLRDSQKS